MLEARAGGVPAQDPRHHVRGRVQPVVDPGPRVPQFIHRYFRKDATALNYGFHECIYLHSGQRLLKIFFTVIKNNNIFCETTSAGGG